MLCVQTRRNGCLTQDILPQESVKVWRQRGALPRLRRVRRGSLSCWTVIREEKPLMATFYFRFVFPSAFCSGSVVSVGVFFGAEALSERADVSGR